MDITLGSSILTELSNPVQEDSGSDVQKCGWFEKRELLMLGTPIGHDVGCYS